MVVWWITEAIPIPVTGVVGLCLCVILNVASVGRLSRGERNTLIAFGVAITLWTLPGLVGLFVGDDSKLYEGLTDRWLDEGVVAVLSAGLLFVLPIDWGRRQFTLTGTRPRGSTGAPSSCSARASPSAG